MSKKLIYLIAISLLLWVTSPPIIAQSSSTNYSVTNGYPVGGGGTSASTNYIATGNVPLCGSGNSASTNFIFNAGIIPAMSYTPAMTAAYAGTSEMVIPMTSRTIKVAVNGGTGTPTGTLHYRLGGGISFISHAMTLGNADTLQYTIPAGDITNRGLEYYIDIMRGADGASIGTTSDPYIFNTQMTNAQGQSAVATPAGQYRIIGVPINVSNHAIGSVFQDDLGTYNDTQWRLGSYNTAQDSVHEFPDATAVYPGVGYWLITRTAHTYGSAGTSVRPNYDYGVAPYYEVTMDQGWNLVANPFAFPIAWNEVLFDDNGTVKGHAADVLDNFAYTYNGAGYAASATIPAWNGFFVHILKSGVSMLFPFHAAGVAAKAATMAPLAETDWMIDLRLEAGQYFDDGNLAGVLAEADHGIDRFDVCEPPPAPDAPRLAFRIEDDADLRRCDFRPDIGTGATWEIEITPYAARDLVISGVTTLPNNLEAWLVIPDGPSYELTGDTRLDLADNVTEARLVIGDPSYVKEELAAMLPTEYDLGQNFPNPFNPTTTIQFALPENSHVRVTVFNIIGQVVATVIDEDMEAGYHQAVWDGTDGDGRAVASGLYFYRLDAGTYSQSRKMVLLK